MIGRRAILPCEEGEMGRKDINGIKGGIQHSSCKLDRGSTHQTVQFQGANHTGPCSPIGGPHDWVCALQELRGPSLQLQRQGPTGPRHGSQTPTRT